MLNLSLRIIRFILTNVNKSIYQSEQYSFVYDNSWGNRIQDRYLSFQFEINLFIKANNTLLFMIIPGVTGSRTDIFLSNLKILKLLAVTFIPAFTTNAMTSDFLLLISHGWVVTFQDSHRTVFTFRSWLDLLDVVLAFWISILKISKLLQNCLHRVIDITSFEKHLESSLDRTPNFCQNLVIFRSKNMYLKESLTRSSTVI